METLKMGTWKFMEEPEEPRILLRMALFGAADLPLFGLSLDLPGASPSVKDGSIGN